MGIGGYKIEFSYELHAQKTLVAHLGYGPRGDGLFDRTARFVAVGAVGVEAALPDIGAHLPKQDGCTLSER